MRLSANNVWGRLGFLIVSVCIASPVFVAEATGFGRLFTTPEQRERINALRTQSSSEVAGEGSSDRLGSLTVKGMVIRSGASPVLWVNDKLISDPKEASRYGITLAPDADKGVPVTIPQPKDLATTGQKGQSFYLKPGQRLNRESGQIIETYRVKEEALNAPTKSAPDTPIKRTDFKRTPAKTVPDDSNNRADSRKAPAPR